MSNDHHQLTDDEQYPIQSLLSRKNSNRLRTVPWIPCHESCKSQHVAREMQGSLSNEISLIPSIRVNPA